VRIALCMSGHARTYDKTYDFWYNNLLSQCYTDVFIHVWDTLGPRWFGSRPEGDRPETRKDYHSGILDSPTVDEESIKKVWNPRSIVIEKYESIHETFQNDIQPILDERNRRNIPEGFEHHHPLSVRSMLYKRMKCNELKSFEEFAIGAQYDVVIQTRLDVLPTRPFDNNIFQNQKAIYFHNSRSATPHPEICDFAAMGTSEQIDLWCNLYYNVNKELDSVGDNFFEFLNPHRLYVKYLLNNNMPYVESDLGLCILRDTGIVLGWKNDKKIVTQYLEGK